jgi:ABC-type bacteriocin/lantibiotic exporter with double-glycine peptidase domain
MNNIKRPRRGGAGVLAAYRLLRSAERLSFVCLTIGRIVVGFCDLLLAAAMYLVFLLLQGGSPVRHLWWVPRTTLTAALVTSALVVLRSFLDVLSMRAVVGYIQNLYTGFLLRLTKGYSEMQWTQFVECNRSELLNHTMYTAREAANFYHCGIDLIAAVAVVAVMTIAIVYQSAEAAVGLVLAVLLFYGVHRFIIRKRLQVAGAQRERSVRLLQRSLAELFSSGKETRTYRNQGFFYERIREYARSAAISNIRVTLLPHIARILSDQGVVLFFLGVMIAIQVWHGDTRRLLSIIVFYFVLSRRLLPLISQISFLSGHIDSSYENVRIVDDELSECLLHRAPAPETRLPDAGFAMELDSVSFWFDETVPILQNVSLCLREGETMVLFGVSGSGKSSLLNLIAGVMQPAIGIVRVNQNCVAYVPQEVALLDDSIRSNLLFGLEDRSDPELMEALAVARLDEFVTAQPLGLRTSVGDNGILLSGGQRQRLGIARAILRGAKLLLLDEATSALDEENEWHLLENLSATGIAVLLVTHRFQAQVGAQRVCRLQDGRLSEDLNPKLSISEERTCTGVAR